jgi:hypothetical protein
LIAPPVEPITAFFMHKFTVTRFALLLALILPPLAQAETLTPFVVHYNASYGGFSAESVRSLKLDGADNRYVMLAETQLTLLGISLSSIHERSEFLWDGATPQPLRYTFEQKGLGARSRGVNFDQDQKQLTWTMDGKSGMLPFDEPVYDDLNGFMEVSRQLREGREDIEFQVADKDAIRTYHYRVLGQETLTTPVGQYNTVHLERVRDPGNERTTEFWLSPELDYLLLRLLQVEPDGRQVQLDARSVERTPATTTVAAQDRARSSTQDTDVTATDR